MAKRHKSARVEATGTSEPDPYEVPDKAPGAPAGETAAYIAEMTGELARLAANAKLDTLSYLLAMAHVEAEMLVRAGGRRD